MRGGIRRALFAQRALIGEALIAAAACAAFVGCAAPSRDPAPSSPAQIAGVVEARYRVVAQAAATGEEPRLLGFVARTRYAFGDGDVVLWLVENDRMQELGYVDQNGRAYANVPFEDRPRWIITASIEDAVRALLRAKDAVALQRLEGEWSAASFPGPASRP